MKNIAEIKSCLKKIADKRENFDIFIEKLIDLAEEHDIYSGEKYVYRYLWEVDNFISAVKRFIDNE